MQDLILATSSECVYSHSKELLSKYLGIEISEMQLYRITDYYGELLTTTLADNTCLHPLQSDTDVLYAMADGSMLLTREDNWKEVKLGRIFSGKSCWQIEGKPNEIDTSQYVSHFGNCHLFTQKMDAVLDAYGNLDDKLIFITDGAVWLRQWIEDAYPRAIAILDFYHAKEYLCAFAKDYFKDEINRKKWVSEQEELMLQSEVSQVIDRIKLMQKESPISTAKKVIAYFSANISRMDYKYYKTIGKGIIGSGAMESAHRTVIQCRMKLSGQRWSKKGLTNMLCLRTIKKNNQWNKVIEITKNKIAA